MMIRLFVVANVAFLLMSFIIIATAVDDEEETTTEEPIIDATFCGEHFVDDGTDAFFDRAAKHFNECGVIKLKGFFDKELLKSIHKAGPNVDRDDMRFGGLRARRIQMLMPYQEPFSRAATEFFGPKSRGLALAHAVLGPRFALDFPCLVYALTNASKQDVHRDTPNDGSIAISIPLQPLHEQFAPITYCAMTHKWTKEQSRKVWMDSVWKQEKGESLQHSVERLLCQHGRKVIGAPLDVGDAVMYNHKAYHWGMQSTELEQERAVLYLAFKDTPEHAGVQPSAQERTDEARKARKDWDAVFEESISELIASAKKEL